MNNEQYKQQDKLVSTEEKFQVYERGTDKKMGKPLTKRGAQRKVVNLDNKYGCYHYYYRSTTQNG